VLAVRLTVSAEAVTLANAGAAAFYFGRDEKMFTEMIRERPDSKQLVEPATKKAVDKTLDQRRTKDVGPEGAGAEDIMQPVAPFIFGGQADMGKQPPLAGGNKDTRNRGEGA